MKLQAKACNFFKKGILGQVFPCEFCEIFKNAIFIERLRWLLLCQYMSEDRGRVELFIIFPFFIISGFFVLILFGNVIFYVLVFFVV